jgi:hypothetical protein
VKQDELTASPQPGKSEKREMGERKEGKSTHASKLFPPADGQDSSTIMWQNPKHGTLYYTCEVFHIFQSSSIIYIWLRVFISAMLCFILSQ